MSTRLGKEVVILMQLYPYLMVLRGTIRHGYVLDIDRELVLARALISCLLPLLC